MVIPVKDGTVLPDLIPALKERFFFTGSVPLHNLASEPFIAAHVRAGTQATQLLVTLFVGSTIALSTPANLHAGSQVVCLTGDGAQLCDCAHCALMFVLQVS